MSRVLAVLLVTSLVSGCSGQQMLNRAKQKITGYLKKTPVEQPVTQTFQIPNDQLEFDKNAFNTAEAYMKTLQWGNFFDAYNLLHPSCQSRLTLANYYKVHFQFRQLYEIVSYQVTAMERLENWKDTVSELTFPEVFKATVTLSLKPQDRKETKETITHLFICHQANEYIKHDPGSWTVITDLSDKTFEAALFKIKIDQGYYYLSINDFALAWETFNHCLELNPLSLNAYYGLTATALLSENHNRVLNYVKTMEQLFNEKYKNRERVKELGWDDVYDTDKRRLSMAYYLAGKACHAMGDKARAKTYFLLSQETDPKNPYADEGLKSLGKPTRSMEDFPKIKDEYSGLF